MVLTGNTALRATLNKDVPPIIDSLESALKDLQRFLSHFPMVETKVYIIEHPKKALKQQLETIAAEVLIAGDAWPAMPSRWRYVAMNMFF